MIYLFSFIMLDFYYILKHQFIILISLLMSNLKYLEFKRLLKELEFIESDYTYQFEVINQGEKIFNESVNSILIQYPDLMSIWDENKKEYKILGDQEVSESIDFIIEPNVRRLYREIVKSTHPDIILSRKLNELYLEATGAYETNNVVTLYKISNDLMIDFEYSDSVIDIIKNEINKYKEQIIFLESTYTYKWLKSDEVEKPKIILNFIEKSIK